MYVVRKTKIEKKMFKVDSREINKCLYHGKKHIRKYKEQWTIEDIVLGKKINGAIKRRNSKRIKEEIEEYGEFLGKREKLKLYMGTKSIVVRDAFDELSQNESVFFWLYNTTNYYDERFGGYTYLDEVLCYLIAFCKNKINNIGVFLNEKGSKKIKAQELSGEDLVENKRKYDNFEFKDNKTFIRVKQSAEKILRHPTICNAMKEIVKVSIEDPDFARAKIINEVQQIAQTSDSDKTRIEAYKLLANLLGIDKPTVQSNVNIQVNAIENDLKRQGFDFDVSDFVVESDES